MYICKNVLSADEIARIKDTIKTKQWEEGKTNFSKAHKNNQELTDSELGMMIGKKINSVPFVRHHCFIHQMTLPRLNQYQDGGNYNKHIDFFHQDGIRTDLSMTLFLNDPSTYDGGELVIEDVGPEPIKIKLNAGDLVIYPSGKPHYVLPVTRGERLAAIAWAQCTVQDEDCRRILSKLVTVMQVLEQDKEKNKEQLINTSYIYNNLMKKWTQV